MSNALPKFSADKAQRAAQIIARNVRDMHDITGRVFVAGARNKWSPEAGQYIVYGLERYFRFENTVDLCAQVERAWKKGADIEPVIAEWISAFMAQEIV